MRCVTYTHSNTNACRDNAAAQIAVPPVKADVYGIGYDPYAKTPEFTIMASASRQLVVAAGTDMVTSGVYRMQDALGGGECQSTYMVSYI